MKNFNFFNRMRGESGKFANTPPYGFNHASRMILSLLLVMFVCVGNVWAATTYKLTQVSSVSAGNKYVFVQDGYAMNNSVNGSNQLLCTNSYNTTGLAGTETYVWTLETATNGLKMRNASLNSDYYLANTSSTNMSFNSTGSVWSFSFSKNVALIQNTSNNRYLGDPNQTGTLAHVFKAYSTNNMNYPHAITVYKLDEESSEPTITLTPATTVDLGTVTIGESNTSTFVVKGSNLKGDITLSGVSAPMSLDVTTVTKADAESANGKTITVTYAPTTKASINQTVTASSEDATDKTITITGQGRQKFAVHYFVGGSEVTTLKEMVIEGQTVSSLPSKDDVTSCDETNYPYFIGWSTSNFGSQTTAPTTLVDGSEAINDETNYYAVFAAGTGGSSSKNYTLTLTYSDVPAQYDGDWTAKDATEVGGSSKFPVSLDGTKIMQSTSSTIQFRKSNGEIHNITDLGNITSITTGNNELLYYIGTSVSPTSGTSGGYFKIYNSTSNANYSSKITVNFTKTVGGDITYTKYITLCCQPLGQINGPISVTNSSAKNVAVSWPATEGGHENGYLVKLLSSTNPTDEVASANVSTTSKTFENLGAGTYYAAVTPTYSGADNYCAEGTETVSSASAVISGDVIVTFDATTNGGSITTGTQSVPYGTATALSTWSDLGGSAPDCKQFIHWNTSADDQGTTYADGVDITASGATTLYAIYGDITYAVTDGTLTGVGNHSYSANPVVCGSTLTITCEADASHKGNPTVEATGTYGTITVVSATQVTIDNVQSAIVVSISYEAKQAATIKLHTINNNVIDVAGDYLEGDTYELPTTAAACDETALYGWYKGTYSHDTDAPSGENFIEKGGQVTLAAGTNDFYAVYATVTPDAADTYTKITTTEQLVSGDYLIVGPYDATYYAMKNVVDDTSMKEKEVTVTTNRISHSGEGKTDYIWRITRTNDAITIKNGEDYFAVSSGNVALGASAENFTFSVSAEKWTLSSGDYNLQYAWYFEASEDATDPVYLFKRDAGIAGPYVTNPNCATHELSYLIDPEGKGSVVLGKTTIAEGKKTTATATPIDDDHKFTGWTITGDGASVANASAATTEVTMGTEDAVLTAHFAEKVNYTVTWMVDGEDDVIAPTQVKEGTKPTFPSNPASCSTASNVFYGWATTSWDGKAANLDDKTVYTGADEIPAVSGNVTYHAVFAEGGLDPNAEPVLSQTLAYDTWTYSGTTTDKPSDSYRLFAENAYVESESFDLGTLKKVNVYAGTYGTLANNKKKVTIGDGTNVWNTRTLSTNKATTQNEITTGTALTGTGKLRVISGGGDGSNTGIRISKVEIYTFGTSYTNFITKCCKDAVTIVASEASHGSFTVKQDETNVVGSALNTCEGTQAVTVACTPATGYLLGEVIQSGASVDPTITAASENVYTITYAQNTTGTSTISVTFVEDTYPSLVVSKENITFGDVAKGSSQSSTFTVEGAHLTGSTLSISSNNDKFSVSPNELTINNGSVAQTTITVTLNTEDADTYNGTITIADQAETPYSTMVSVSGTVKEQYTINWYDGSSLLDESATYLDGDEVVKPVNPTPCDESISFMGWTTADAWEGKQDDAPAVLMSTSQIPATANANVNYRAVYAKSTQESWRKVEFSTLTNTDVFVMAHEGSATYAAMKRNGTNAKPIGQSVTVANNMITSEVADAMKWKVSGNATDGYTFSAADDATNKLYSSTSASNSSNENIKVGTGGEYNRIIFEYTNDGWLATKDSYTKRYVSYVSQSNDWRGYVSKSTSATNLVFFKYIAPVSSGYMTDCAVSYSATYQAGLGEGDDVIVNNIAQGANHTVLGNDATNFSKVGYAFNGWQSGSETYAAGDTYVNVTEDLIFIAQWVEKADAEMSFGAATYEAAINGTFEAPELNNPHGVEVAYSSNNESIATVDPITGAITLVANAKGDVVITATSVETETYKISTASYTLSIGEAPASTNVIWVPATELYDGMQVLFVGNVESGNNAGNYAMGAQADNNRKAIKGTLANDVFTPNAGTKEFTLEKQDDGIYAIKTSTGEYLFAAGSSDNYMRTQSNVDVNAKWTITLSDGGVASISANGSSNRHVMQFNTTSQRFSCYANANQGTVKIFTPMMYKRTVRPGYYGTICLPSAGQISGATLYEIAYYDQTSKKIYFDEIVNGQMEAGVPYIFQPEENQTQLSVVYSNFIMAENAGESQGLHGHYDLNNPEEGSEAARKYLTYGDYFLRNNEYWMVDQENRVYVDNYRAYITLSEIDGYPSAVPAPGRKRIWMQVNGEQVATGIENGEATEAPRKVLINGEMYIIIGEKAFDATGKLVK